MKKGVTELTGMRNKKRVNPFVQIDKNMLSDKNISWKAKGILSYLLSKPDGWITYLTDVEKQSTDGKDSVSSGVKELEKAGYIERKRIREKGRFKGWEYNVYEYPQPINAESGFSGIGETENGKSEDGETDVGKSDTSNNDLSNNDLSNNDLSINNNNPVGREPIDLIDPEWKEARDFYESQGFGDCAPMIGDMMAEWIKDLSKELVIHAMKVSVENGVAKWRYVEKILRDWAHRKIKSVEQYEALELKRDFENQQKKKASSGKGGYRSGREEKTPEWFGKDKPKKEVAPVPGKTKEEVDAERAALIKELQGDS